MHTREVSTNRGLVLRLSTGEDWRHQIERAAREHDVDAGWFTGLGAVRSAELWYYDQDAGSYEPFTVDRHMEVAACVGNISHLDDSVFAHTHAVLSDPDGGCVAGHLEAAETFAGEVFIQAFETPMSRQHDPTTDLDLWNFADGD